MTGSHPPNQMLDEHRQIRLDRTPDHTVSHVQVLVGEEVAEAMICSPCGIAAKSSESR
jgi:hypothetical protein